MPPAAPARPADLTKVVVTWGGADVAFAPVWITYNAGLFKKHGLDVELSGDVQFIHLGGPELVSAAAAGADIVALVMQIAPQGFHALVDLAKLRIPAALTVSAKRSWVNAHRDVVQRYMDALLEGIDLEKRDKAYAVSVISDYLKISDQALVASTYDFYAKKCRRPWPTSGPSNPNLKNFDVRTMIDNSFLENAAKKRR